MFIHSREPQTLDSLPTAHPLHGIDLRTLSDSQLADGAARAILPGFDRVWSYLAPAYETHPEISDLISSALRRITRVLIQRITIANLLSRSRAPDLETQDDILDAVTLAYIHMAGAFDAVAIANGLLAGQEKFTDMGWQKSAFRKAVRQTAPEAVALMEPHAEGGKLLRAVLDFRNTIHRRMPDPAASGGADGDPALHEMTLVLERRSHGEILEAFQAIGWTRYVGVRLLGNRLLLRPETAVGLMLTDGIPVVNSLLDMTPVDLLKTSPFDLDPDNSMHPTQLRNYAADYITLTHLVEPS